VTEISKRAGLYQRVSVLAHGADARAVDEQNDANAAACARNDWTPAERYADPGRSASRFARRHREEYGRLMADLRAGKLDILILWEPSRGSRELEEWARLLNVCREHEASIYITSHDRLYRHDSGRDWRSLAEDGVDSAYESEKTSARVRRALASNAVRGRPHGKVPYGYQRSYDPRSGKLAGQEAHPVNSLIAGEVIDRVSEGDPLTVIAKDMTARAIPSPQGGGWTASTVRRIAVNRAYIARRVSNAAETPAIWPAIVDESVFWRAQRVLSDPSRQRIRPGAARHLLTYVASCGQCGGGLLTANTIRGVPYYVCEKHRCTGIREDWLDLYVTSAVGAVLDDPRFWDNVGRSGDAEVMALRAKADELRAELREHLALVKARKLSPASFAEIEGSLLAQIGGAEALAESVAAPPVLRDLDRGAEGALAAFEGAPLAVRKQVLREMFSEITLLAARRKGRQPFDPERVRIVPRWAVSGDEPVTGSLGPK
jgi:DNA invertase Pin-like site-specific DNA recombinase